MEPHFRASTEEDLSFHRFLEPCRSVAEPINVSPLPPSEEEFSLWPDLHQVVAVLIRPKVSLGDVGFEIVKLAQ